MHADSFPGTSQAALLSEKVQVHHDVSRINSLIRPFLSKIRAYVLLLLPGHVAGVTLYRLHRASLGVFS